MRVSIIVEDGTVVIDGESISGIVLSSVPNNVSAMQWYDTYGEVEYFSSFIDGVMTKPVNTIITSLSDYQFAIDAHAVAKQQLIDNAEEVVEITEKVD